MWEFFEFDICHVLLAKVVIIFFQFLTCSILVLTRLG